MLLDISIQKNLPVVGSYSFDSIECDPVHDELFVSLQMHFLCIVNFNKNVFSNILKGLYEVGSRVEHYM